MRPDPIMSVLARTLPVTLALSLGISLTAGDLEPAWPMPGWLRVTPAEVDLDETQLAAARDYALTGGGAGYVVRSGRLAFAWGDPKQRYDLKSTTKSFGAAALGLAVLDGKVRLSDQARAHHPTLGTPPDSNANTGWLDEITMLHLASQTAGFDKPGGYVPLLFRPGTTWAYSDSGPNWLAECLTLAYGCDLDGLMFERLFAPLGIKRTDLVWRQNQYRPDRIEGFKRREFGAGISANVDAMARFGLLWLREGEWQGSQLLPRDFVRQATSTDLRVSRLPVHKPEEYGRASDHYGLLWWNNADGAIRGVPRDTYWSWGLYDSLIVVMPTLDIVVARAGKSWKRTEGADHYDVLRPFLQPIAAAARPTAASSSFQLAVPYPPSPLIAGIEWAAKEKIIRKAPGSDNWPITWADDDALYTAYGDGNGFAPFTPEKLSLGFARITGTPTNFVGVNLRSPTGEARGDGVKGRKASGIVCVDGQIYLLARNAGNAQLAWSSDRGATWTWADWKFTTSFGCPTFLNFGRNYVGGRDEFVYLYSPDTETAYEPADRMVLARAPKDRLRDRTAYEFFVRLEEGGQAGWTPDIAKRGAVFTHPGRCYRSSISYNRALRRYLWVQTLPQSRHPQGPRFQGGFGIYDASEPWGPWTTLFFTEDWDVGPGETASLPTKWVSADGWTLHLVFSGDDAFSVRKGTLVPHPRPAPQAPSPAVQPFSF